MKLENLNSSLFENFEENELNNSAAIIAGRTSRRKDCNTSCGDGDTKWRDDFTVRSSDGCNEPSIASPTTGVVFSVASSTLSSY